MVMGTRCYFCGVETGGCHGSYANVEHDNDCPIRKYRRC